MNQYQPGVGEGPEARVLAFGRSGECCVEVIECPDGSLAVRCDGAVPGPYRWARGQMEACVKTYLHLLGR